MVTKKTERANLENKKVVFFEIGMVLTLASALVAIEWCSAGPQNTGSFSDNPKNNSGWATREFFYESRHSVLS